MNWFKVAQVAGAIQTENFKQWFGNSIVIDEQGKPLIVYKGMPATNWETGELFEEIDRSQSSTPSSFGGGNYAGFFSSKPEVAARFADVLTWEGLGNAIYPVYLKIERPFVIDAQGDFAANVQFGKEGEPFREALVQDAYDGVIMLNTQDEGDIYVPKTPYQIKSIYSAGDFNTESPKLGD
jgi:hypothetical protein